MTYIALFFSIAKAQKWAEAVFLFLTTTASKKKVHFWFSFHLLFHTNDNSVSEITLAISMTRMIADHNYPLADIKRESGICNHQIE